MAYGAVFARSIDALQHNQESALALRVELVLPFVDNGTILCALLFGCLAVWEGRGVGSIALAEIGTGARLNSKLGCDFFCHGSFWFGPHCRDCAPAQTARVASRAIARVASYAWNNAAPTGNL